MRQAEMVSGCVNARLLGIWRVSAGEYALGRQSDGWLLPGVVKGTRDRARRCWHALWILDEQSEAVILGIDPDTAPDTHQAQVLADWERLCD